MMPLTVLPAGWLNNSKSGSAPLITTNRGIGMTSQRTRDRLVVRLREEGIRNEAVLDVIRNTPRHLFVDEALASRAYEDTALPIGYNQTISQPYVVAAMTDLIISGHPQARRAGTAALPQTGAQECPRQLFGRHGGIAGLCTL
jgi:protein-L-isoaspartate(D-aspartate) O-methyltransferase